MHTGPEPHPFSPKSPRTEAERSPKRNKRGQARSTTSPATGASHKPEPSFPLFSGLGGLHAGGPFGGTPKNRMSKRSLRESVQSVDSTTSQQSNANFRNTTSTRNWNRPSLDIALLPSFADNSTAGSSSRHQPSLASGVTEDRNFETTARAAPDHISPADEVDAQEKSGESSLDLHSANVFGAFTKQSPTLIFGATVLSEFSILRTLMLPWQWLSRQ